MDGTDISELMQCFLKKEILSDKFPKLVQRVKYYKEDEEGVETMCEIMEREHRAGWTKGREEGRAEGRAEGIIEGRAEERINIIVTFLSKSNGTEEGAREMLDATDEEIAAAKEKMRTIE